MGIGCSEHNISSLMFSQCTKNVLGHNFLACFSEIFFQFLRNIERMFSNFVNYSVKYVTLSILVLITQCAILIF